MDTLSSPRWKSGSPVSSASIDILMVTYNRARYTRLSLRFSKKLRNLKAAVAVFVAHYNFCKIHSAIDVTPAMESGLTGRLWSLEDILAA